MAERRFCKPLTEVRFPSPAQMKLNEAVKWLRAFKKARFKCIMPNQVFEALMVVEKAKKRGTAL